MLIAGGDWNANVREAFYVGYLEQSVAGCLIRSSSNTEKNDAYMHAAK